MRYRRKFGSVLGPSLVAAALVGAGPQPAGQLVSEEPGALLVPADPERLEGVDAEAVPEGDASVASAPEVRPDVLLPVWPAPPARGETMLAALAVVPPPAAIQGTMPAAPTLAPPPPKPREPSVVQLVVPAPPPPKPRPQVRESNRGVVAARQDPQGPATTMQLQQELEARDAIISNLMQRVQQLERLAVAIGSEPPTAARQEARSEPPIPPPPAPRPEPAISADQAQQETKVARAAPGQFDVDEEAVDRALERALVQVGALLLPAGWAEVEPSISYARQTADLPDTLIVQGDQTGLISREVRRNEVESRTALRFGLPFDSQAEFEIPYRYVDQSTVISGGALGRSVQDNDAWGYGDVRVGLAKTLMREQGWRPDLIARVRWDSDTGQTDDNIALGSGFHEIGGFLTAVKRQDPLAFVGSVGYEAALENDDIDPGDEFSIAFGTVLAASPETSLRFSIQQTFANELEVDGQKIDGTDEVNAMLTVGASSIIAPRTLLDVAAGIGITDKGTDYSVVVSLPIRFDLRGVPTPF